MIGMIFKIISIILFIVLIVSLVVSYIGSGIYVGIKLKYESHSIFGLLLYILFILLIAGAKIAGLIFVYRRTEDSFVLFHLIALVFSFIVFGIISQLLYLLANAVIMVVSQSTDKASIPVFFDVLKEKMGDIDQSTVMGISVLKVTLLDNAICLLLELFTVALIPLIIISYFLGSKFKFCYSIANFVQELVDDEKRPMYDVITGERYSIANEIAKDDLWRYNNTTQINNLNKERSDQICNTYDKKSVVYRNEVQSMSIFTPNDYDDLIVTVDRRYDNYYVEAKVYRNGKKIDGIDFHVHFNDYVDLNSIADSITKQILSSLPNCYHFNYDVVADQVLRNL